MVLVAVVMAVDVVVMISKPTSMHVVDCRHWPIGGSRDVACCGGCRVMVVLMHWQPVVGTCKRKDGGRSSRHQ